MKWFLFLLIVTFTGVWVNAQTPSPNYWKLVITDVVGNRDSIEFGYDSTATIGLDANETNYYGLPYSDLDFRSLVYDTQCVLPAYGVSGRLELKRDFRNGFNGRAISSFPELHNVIAIKFKAVFFPLRVEIRRNYLLSLHNAGYWMVQNRGTGFEILTFQNSSNHSGMSVDYMKRVTHNTTSFQINNNTGIISPYYLMFINNIGLLDNLLIQLTNYTAQPQPNPTANRFTIPGVGREGVLSLVNASGRVVRQESFVPGSEVDISGLPKGLYLFRLVSEGSVTQGKVVRE